MPKPFSITAQHFGGGLQLSKGVENLKPEELSVAENVRFNEQGGVCTRFGYELQSGDGTGSKTDSMGVLEAYGVIFRKVGTAIQQSLDGATWYSIGVTRTAGAVDYFLPRGKDMYVVNPTDGFLRIAVSTLATQITGASTEVVVRTGDGAQFTNGAAVIYIQGDEINYNGVSTDTLGSATNIATTHAVGTVITQTTAVSANPKGTCMADLKNQCLVAGVSANASWLYYSDFATTADTTKYYTFSGGFSGSLPLPYNITALCSGIDVVVIGTEQGMYYCTGFNASTGAAIVNELTRTHGIPNAKCITTMEDMIVCFTGRHIIPISYDVNGVRLAFDPVNKKNNIDDPIGDDLEDLDDDQSSAFIHYDPVKRELTVCAYENSISKEYVYNRDTGTWSIDTGKDFNCKANFLNRVYCGAQTSADVFLQDEGYTDNDIPIVSRIVTGVYTMDDKRMTSDYLKLTFGGLLNATGVFTLRIYVNGEEALEQVINATDLQTANLMDVTTGVPIGGGTLGAETIGTGGNAADAYAFQYPLEMFYSGERFQIEWEVNDEGSLLELRDSRLDGETETELDYDNQ